MVEKRRHPRVAAEFPLRLGELSSATVRDISHAGVRCVTPSPLSPMTLVGLLLEIPTGRRGADSYLEIPCQGVVVRSSVVEEDGSPCYEAAILFRDLNPRARELIEAYVDRHLSSPAG